jgi:uncharacterized FlaG/YvyC family protein
LVTAFFDTFTDLLEQEKNLVDAERKSPLTEKIAEADKRIDKCITGINNAVKAGLSHFDPAVVDAAKVLTIRMKALGRIKDKPYEEESADVQILLSDFANRLSNEVMLLKLDTWVDELTASESEFTSLFEQRSTETVSRPQDSLKNIRREIESVYKNMIIAIQNEINVKETTDTTEFARILNEQIKYFNEHAHHKTQKDIAEAVVESIPDQTYTGKQIIVIPQVRYGDEDLTLATDFDLAYSKNIERGNAEIIIHGKGNYKNKKTVTFNII